MEETSKRRILIVDDDPMLLKALGTALRAEGYATETANGGQAGIDAFHKALKNNEPFAAVITDLGMNEVDGRQVAASVKSASPATPVILLTGWGKWFEVQAGNPMQVDCVLAKPPKLAELREVLARNLKPRGG